MNWPQRLYCLAIGGALLLMVYRWVRPKFNNAQYGAA